ncbi:hypothetical protein F5Y14DRAFT_400286 [Nemania sp. NC0429]|nr:hypothetical protein F5Y14DRAFT_400286 [Nemania sp. NC0429]
MFRSWNEGLANLRLSRLFSFLFFSPGITSACRWFAVSRLVQDAADSYRIFTMSGAKQDSSAEPVPPEQRYCDGQKTERERQGYCSSRNRLRFRVGFSTCKLEIVQVGDIRVPGTYNVYFWRLTSES